MSMFNTDQSFGNFTFSSGAEREKARQEKEKQNDKCHRDTLNAEKNSGSDNNINQPKNMYTEWPYTEIVPIKHQTDQHKDTNNVKTEQENHESTTAEEHLKTQRELQKRAICQNNDRLQTNTSNKNEKNSQANLAPRTNGNATTNTSSATDTKFRQPSSSDELCSRNDASGMPRRIQVHCQR